MVFDTEAGGGIRMERGTVTTAEALADVERDPALATPAMQCAVYRQFVRWAHEPTRRDYPRMVGGACAQFPLPDADAS